MDQTRIVRLGSRVDREEAENQGTVIKGISEWMSVRGLFDANQRELAKALREEGRPGVLVFVLRPKGIEGQLWLSATDALRSGSVGRHGCADLHLPGEDALSLRHCVVLVRRLGDGVRLHVVDLGSSAGLLLEDGQAARAVDCDGHLLSRVPGGVVACFPTGTALPWDPEARRPFDTLAPREVSTHALLPRPLWLRGGPADEVSRVTRLPGPRALDTDNLLIPGEVPAGWLTLASAERCERLPVGFSALDSGVVLGRYDRCSFHRVMSDENLSRVHALLLRRDERVYLIDAGSMNGTWLGEREIRCARVKAMTPYGLGAKVSLLWEPAD